MEPIKSRITHYWSQRSDSFAAQRLREYRSEKRGRWLSEINRYLPVGRPLRILDLGTGTGFFALMLSAEGHETVGIDLTEDMIARAMEAAAAMELDAAFRVMDAEQPDLEPESFDALVTRNLTWTLPHLPTAYKNWYRLLRPGGVLINFDADYCRAEPAGTPLPENHAHTMLTPQMLAMNDAISRELLPCQSPRPQWDVQLLAEAGFEHITVDTGIYGRIYAEQDEFYNPTPIFTIAAYK